MRAKATSPAVRAQQDPSRTGAGKGKREFLVEQHRKEFDDYMLSQVRRNRKSVKRIKKTVDHLRSQMDELRDQNRRQRCEYEQLTHDLKAVRRQLSEPRVELTARRSPKSTALANCNKTRKQLATSRESSFSARSSGVEAPRGKSLKGRQEGTSKTVLKRKIEDLKERAHRIKKNAAEIQQEIHRKIERKLEHSPTKPHAQQRQQQQQGDHNDTKAYEQLMELLRTNKRIQDPLVVIPTQKAVQSKQEVSLNEQAPVPNYSDKSMLSTNRDPTPLKNSAAASYYDPKPPSPLASETNLLDSDKHIGQTKRALKLSRCVNVQVGEGERGERGEKGQEGEFSGLLRECRGSGSQLSFEGPDSEQHLKEMEFEFDQLVRQELMSNEPKEKEALGRSIRSLLDRIAVLRQQLQSHDS